MIRGGGPARVRVESPLRGLLACLGCCAALAAGTSCRTAESPPTPTGGPIVLVVVDALRADHLGTYGYDRPTSPDIDRWAAGARVFERAYATSPWTLPSFGSILTGHLPSGHSAGVEVDERGANVEVAALRNFVTLGDVPTVAELLAHAGYGTAAFVTNPFLDPRFGLGRGFERYDHFEASNEALRPAGEVVDMALGYIDDRGDAPAFVMLHLFEPHLDYDAPEPHRGRFSGEVAGGAEAARLSLPVRGLWPIRNRVAQIDAAEREFIVAAYDEEIAAVDAAVGSLLRGLDDRGLLDTALVLLTADHGEELFDHGGFEHGHSMHEEVLRVPLILSAPGATAGRVERPVSIADVAPTILEFAGADVPTAVAGRSLLAGAPPERGVVAERVLYGPESKAIIEWPYKAILEVDSGTARLYDLARDPGETRDLAASQPDRLSGLIATLAEQLDGARLAGSAGSGSSGGATTDAELDEDLVARLRALGYIGGEATDPEPGPEPGSNAVAAIELAGIRLLPDPGAFEAPPPPAPVAFDLVSADMDQDGDPDFLINWHNVGALEIFDNRGARLALLNPIDDDPTGVFENRGIATLFADRQAMVRTVRRAGRPGVFVWHDLDRSADWNLYVVRDGGEDAVIELRGNTLLTVRGEGDVVRRADQHEVELAVDEDRLVRVGAELVATSLAIESSLPIYAGADLQPLGRSAVLWKDDPHGIAWLDARAGAAPEIFVTRGGLRGSLAPPHDPKTDRLFERRESPAAGELLYDDLRGLLPEGYGRGRKVEWVDVDGDMAAELYIGNTDSANALLAVGPSGAYVDVAASSGIDFFHGDVFAWLDVDDDGLDDLVYLDADGFRVAYNRGGRVFESRPGHDVGLDFPAGSEAGQRTGIFSNLSLYVVDYDSDGRLDLWLAGHGEQRRHALYRGTDGGFVDATVESGLDAAPLTNELVIADLDNDGYHDALTFGEQAVLLRNRGGRFESHELGGDLGFRVFTRGVAADVDGDGRLDVVLADDSRLLLRNETEGGGMLRVAVRAANEPVGAVVSAVYADGMVQAQRVGSAHGTKYSQGSGALHFGVPEGNPVERLVIRWPDGVSTERVVAAGESSIELRR